MTAFAAAMGAAVIATDIDPARVAAIRRQLGHGRARSFTAFVSDSAPLPVADETATRIMCTEVLEHVADPRAVRAELFRVGKPGAVYLLTVPDETAERLQVGIAPPSYWERPNHVRVFSRPAFGDLVTDAGLVIDQRLTTGFFWALWWVLFWAAEAEFGEPEPPVLALLADRSDATLVVKLIARPFVDGRLFWRPVGTGRRIASGTGRLAA